MEDLESVVGKFIVEKFLFVNTEENLSTSFLSRKAGAAGLLCNENRLGNKF